jgi:hypothetical protein
LSVYALAPAAPTPAEPYITIAEYRQAPTGIDTTTLVRGDEAATIAELGNIIYRASSWADMICYGSLGTLAATIDVDAGRVMVTSDGLLKIHPRQAPVRELMGLSFGAVPNSMTAMTDLSGAWVEDQSISISLNGVTTSFFGSLGFSDVRPGRFVYATWTYIAGWPNTTLTVAANAGDLLLNVGSSTGAIPGSTITIYDGAQTEQVTVVAPYTAGATTINVSSGLKFAHPQLGVSVSAFPASVKQAVILLTSELIRTRGQVSLVAPGMGGVGARTASKGKDSTDAGMDSSGVELAIELLDPFRRVR